MSLSEDITRRRYCLGAIVLIGFLLRGAVAMLALRDFSIPRWSDDYLALAQMWIHSWIYPANFHQPLYILVCRVSLLSGGLNSAIILILASQVLTGTLCIPVADSICQMAIGKNDSSALITALLVAIDPLLVVQSAFILTEALYTIFLLSSTYFVFSSARTESIPWRLTHLFSSGLLLGLAFLTRPNAIVVMPLALIIVLRGGSLWSKKKLASVTVYCLALAICILPICWWNYLRFGYFSPSSSGKYNLAAIAIGPAKSVYERKAPEADLDIWKAELGEEHSTQNPFELANRAADVALRWAFEHPRFMLKEVIKSQCALLVSPWGSAWSRVFGWGEGSSKSRLARVCITAFRFLTLALACFGVYKMIKGPFAAYVVFLLLVVGGHLLVLGAAGYGRFLSPVVPYMDILAAAGIISCVELRRRFRKRGMDSH